jgi:hypothetical protein
MPKLIHGVSPRKHGVSPRKRGAQPHNYNAYKHGLYSKYLNTLNLESLNQISSENIAQEIQIIRVMLKRHLEMRRTHPPQSPEETLTDLRVISFAEARLASLMRLYKNLPAEVGETTDWIDDIMNEPFGTLPSGSDDPSNILQ